MITQESSSRLWTTVNDSKISLSWSSVHTDYNETVQSTFNNINRPVPNSISAMGHTMLAINELIINHDAYVLPVVNSSKRRLLSSASLWFRSNRDRAPPSPPLRCHGSAAFACTTVSSSKTCWTIYTGWLQGQFMRYGYVQLSSERVENIPLLQCPSLPHL